MNEQPLRVLTITPDFPPALGGIQLLVHRVLTHFTRSRSRVVTIRPPDRHGDGSHDVVYSPRAYDHRLQNLLMNGRAVREAWTFRPDVVLAAHIVASPAAATIARLLNVPAVLYAYGKELGASPRLTSFAARTSTAVIAISRYTQSLVLDAGADDGKLHIIPPGVDQIEPTGQSRLVRPTILTVARLDDRYKGHDYLIRALPLIRARVPDVEWVVVGGGQLGDEIVELAEANGVSDATVMLGSVSDHERNVWLDRAHVFAMPSRLPAGRSAGEGFGIVYLEAGLHQLPVVAGNVGGALDAVVHGETGLLVDPTSTVAIADAITTLLLDEPAARRMGDAGRRHAHKFSWPSISARVEDVLFSAAQRNQRGNYG